MELPNKVAKSVENMNKMLGETKNLALAAASAFAGGLTGAIGGVIDLLKSGIDYGIKFGKTVIEAAKERGLVMTALETQLGDRDQASALYGRMLKLAQLTPSSNQQIISFGKRFLTSQFTGDKFDAALKASIDLQALHNDNIAGQYVYLLQKVKSKGVAMRGDMNSVSRYISGSFVYDSLAQQLGYDKEKDPTKRVKMVQDAMAGRKVSGEMFISATQEGLLKMVKQKALGSYGIKKGTESLAGVLSNIGELHETFLQSFDIDKLPGITSLNRFLADFMSFFDVTTKEGKVLQGVVSDITNAMFGGLDAITKKDMAGWLDGAVNVAKKLVTLIQDLWKWVDKILHGKWGEAFGAAINVLIDVAHVIGAAIWEGIKAAMPGIGGGDGKTASEMARQLLGGGGETPSAAPLPSNWNGRSGEFSVITMPQPLPAGEGVLARQPAYGVPDLAGMTRESMKDVGQAGAEGFKEGAAGREGLDNRSPSHAMYKIGMLGAEGFKRGARDGMGGAGLAIYGDVNVTVQADSAEERVKFQSWLLEALREVQEEAGAA